MQPDQHPLTNALISDVANLRGLRTVTAKKGNGAAEPENSHLSATAPCPWCGALVVRRKFGKHTKIFCDTNCRNDFNNGLAWLGKFLGRCANEPGLLRATMDNLANADSPSLTTRERATSPSRVSGKG